MNLSSSSGRPLLVRFGALGDMVLITPTIRFLAGHFGAPVDILSSGAWTPELLTGQQGVGRVFLIQQRKLPWPFSQEKRGLVAALRQSRPLGAWYCDTDNRLVGLLARCGLGSDRVHRVSQVPMADNEHVVEHMRRFVSGSLARYGAGESGAAQAIGSDPQLEVGAAARADLDDWLGRRGLSGQRLLLIQPGNKRTMRRGSRSRPTNTKWWPEAHWAHVVQALARRDPGARILMLGVPQEAGLNDEILAMAGVPTALNVATELPLPRLLALQSVAAGMVSVDTGPAHSAAALGCPVVVLFGIADPVRIRPRGGPTPVEVVTGYDDGQPSLRAIEPDSVLAAWDRLQSRISPWPADRSSGLADRPRVAPG